MIRRSLAKPLILSAQNIVYLRSRQVQSTLQVDSIICKVDCWLLGSIFLCSEVLCRYYLCPDYLDSPVHVPTAV